MEERGPGLRREDLNDGGNHCGILLRVPTATVIKHGTVGQHATVSRKYI